MSRGLTVGAAGVLVAIGVGGALVPLRDPFGNTNMALVLVVVVVAAAALGGRLAGAMTSVAAALSYNFFYARPYFTLAVNDREDATTIVLLLVVGLIVGELANLSTAHRASAKTQAADTRRLREVAGLVASGAPLDQLWPAAQSAIVEELGLRSCRFEPAPYSGPLPSVRPSGRLEGPLEWSRQGFALPPTGSQLVVEHDGRLLGRLVLDPVPGHGVSVEQRRTAVALADQLAVALDRSRPLSPLS
jgi:hypothetical protein